MGNLPLALKFEDMTREQSESLRKSANLDFNPVASHGAVAGSKTGSTIKVATNPKYFAERPGKLEEIARHETSHAIDRYFGKTSKDGSIIPASMIADSAAGSWMRTPDNSRRWKSAIIDKHVARLSGSSRIEAMQKYVKRYHYNNPKEVFSQIFAGGSPELDTLRNELVGVLGGRKYHSGGMVPGSSEQGAILRGGEYIMSRGQVQAFKNGGMVAKGSGTSSASGGSGGVYELTLSGEAKTTIESLSTTLQGAGDSIRQVFADVPGQIRESIEGFPAQLESSSQVLSEAATQFQSSVGAMQETVVQLPEAITTALGTVTTSLEQSTVVFGTAIGEFVLASSSFGQSVGQLAEIMTGIAAATESMRGAATEMKDALAQEIKISVTHTHDPITVRVENGETTTQDGGAFQDMIMNVVGPELDKLRDRIRENGFGIA